MRNNLTYNQVLTANRELGETLKSSPVYSIRILSNITVNQISDILEYNLRSKNINVETEIGHFNTMIQDAASPTSTGCTVIFKDYITIFDDPNFIEDSDIKKIDSFIQQTTAEYDLLFNELKNCPLVIVNLLCPLFFFPIGEDDCHTYFCNSINSWLKNNKPHNVKLIDVSRIIAELSIESSFDHRFYYSAAAPYTIPFFKKYVEALSSIILIHNGKGKKALIFDCDNTLWNGIAGEDSIDELISNSLKPSGKVFKDVQSYAKRLKSQGVILGLCSKNNPADIKDLFESLPDTALSWSDFTVKQINWKDKAENLLTISEELNIGADSIVFIDDSPQECERINEALPEIHTLTVPNDIFQYPSAVRSTASLFHTGKTTEDQLRTVYYDQEKARREILAHFNSVDDYLNSLNLNVFYSINKPEAVKRLANLSQKSNQFNFTQLRYSESQLTQFIANGTHQVWSFSVSDKFGDYGITGGIVIRTAKDTATIENFFMSCRIIGRKIESSILSELLTNFSKKGINSIEIDFKPSERNFPAQEFLKQFDSFNNCNFSIRAQSSLSSPPFIKLQKKE